MSSARPSQSQQVGAAKARRSLRNGFITLILAGALVVGLLLAVPGLKGVATTVSHMKAGWVAVAILLEVLSCACYVVVFLQVFSRAPFRVGARIALSEEAFGAAVSLGGVGSLAVGGWLMLERGAPAGRIAERSAVLFLYTSAINVITLILAGLGLFFGLAGPSNPLLSVAAFEPAYAKVLVRYNAQGDAELNRRQAARLAQLGDWLHGTRRKFLFELLVPPTPRQLERVGGDADRYDRELRPDLMIATVRELQTAGVEPDIWKIEGLDTREDCVRLAEAARSGGRDAVDCVVLGRGGNESKVERWLQTAAGVPGFVGFAVGRTMWWDPLEEWLAGESADEPAKTIAAKYIRLVDTYAAAERARA